MAVGLKSRLGAWLTRWLTKELHEPDRALLYDFDRLCYEIRPGDVILVEGRSRVSDVIKLITQSPWTHAALYIGRLYDIHDDALQAAVGDLYDGDPDDQLIIEALLGEGTVVHSLDKYRQEHLRVCRPKGLARTDAQKVIAYAIGRLGTNYDVRQLLDLARFMFPFWALLPRRWRSSLFAHNPGQPTRTVCSSMLGAAFSSVHFPVLPFVERTPEGKVHLYKRNPRLFTPRDFDYSPYFEIIKYPVFGLDDISIYQRLPWGNIEQYCNDIDDCYLNPPPVGQAASTRVGPVPASLEPPEPTSPEPGDAHVHGNSLSVAANEPRRHAGIVRQQVNLRTALTHMLPRITREEAIAEKRIDAAHEHERHSA